MGRTESFENEYANSSSAVITSNRVYIVKVTENAKSVSKS
jgi:hypothetical protein